MLTHGANPGLVSHFVKQALLDIARDTGLRASSRRATARGWARAGRRALGIKVIHIAERDTQVGPSASAPGEFVNTWSIDGFVGEACSRPSSAGARHENHFPPTAAHEFGCGAAIYLQPPGRRDAGAHLDAARRRRITAS